MGDIKAGSNEEIYPAGEMEVNQGLDLAGMSKSESNQGMDAVGTFESETNQEIVDPVCVSGEGSNQEMDPAGTSNMEARSNQETDPVSSLNAKSNKDSDSMSKVGSSAECGSAVKEDQTVSGVFALQIQTCVFTGEEWAIQSMKVTNVLSFSCVCLKCEKGFCSQSSVKLHMRKHLQDDDIIASSDGEGLSGHESIGKTEFRAQQSHDLTKCNQLNSETDGSKVKKQGTQKRKCGAPKRKDCAHEDVVAGSYKHSGNHTGKVGGDPHTRADGDNHESDRHSAGGGIGKGRGKRRSTRISRRQVVRGNEGTSAETCDKRGSSKITQRKVLTKRSTPPSLLKDQSSVDKGEKSHSCPVCGRRFRLNAYVTQHMKIHTGEKPHICTICGKAFAKLAYMKSHAISHMTERPHPCTVCGKSFARLSVLREHTGIHEGRTFVCSFCEKSFTHRSTLIQHVKKMHEVMEDYTCEVCGKVFKGARRLKKHSLIHDRPHSCAECGQTFSMKYLCLEHMRKHTGEKPLGCSQCGETFRMRSSLVYHMKTHHRNTGVQDHEEAQGSPVAFQENPLVPDINSKVEDLTDQLTSSTTGD